jgi:hypothetical protein
MNEKIIDILTGEEIIREFTAEEITEIEKKKNKAIAETQAKNASRQAVLDKLGLTAEEIAALLS